MYSTTRYKRHPDVVYSNLTTPEHINAKSSNIMNVNVNNIENTNIYRIYKYLYLQYINEKIFHILSLTAVHEMILYCTVYIVHCTVYTVQCTVYNVHSSHVHCTVGVRLNIT